MYVHSVVVKMCWVAGCHIWKCVSCVYRIWNCPIRSCHVAEVLPVPRFYQILSWKKKEQIFIRGLSKKYGFASQGFLVVRGNGRGFLWSGRHTCRWKGVGVCQQSPVVIIFYKGYSPPKMHMQWHTVNINHISYNLCNII